MLNFFLLIILTSFSNEKISLKLMETAEVENVNSVMLGEIAEISCSSFCKDLYFLKISSSNGYISRLDLEKSLGKSFDNFEISGKVTKIYQKTDSLTNALTHALTKYVLNMNKLGNTHVEVRLMNLNYDDHKNLDLKNISFESADFKGVSGRYFFKTSNGKYLDAQINVLADVIMAKTNISQNQDFTKNNTFIQRKSITAPNLINTYEEISNYRSTCFIEIGQAIKKQCLNSRPLVLRGELIKLEIISGNINISTNAEALRDGSLNDIIDVKNLFSNEKIKARVVKENTVEVRIWEKWYFYHY